MQHQNAIFTQGAIRANLEELIGLQSLDEGGGHGGSHTRLTDLLGLELLSQAVGVRCQLLLLLNAQLRRRQPRQRNGNDRSRILPRLVLELGFFIGIIFFWVLEVGILTSEVALEVERMRRRRRRRMGKRGEEAMGAREKETRRGRWGWRGEGEEEEERGGELVGERGRGEEERGVRAGEMEAKKGWGHFGSTRRSGNGNNGV